MRSDCDGNDGCVDEDCLILLQGGMIEGSSGESMVECEMSLLRVLCASEKRVDGSRSYWIVGD